MIRNSYFVFQVASDCCVIIRVMNSLKLLLLLLVILFCIYLFQLRFPPQSLHKDITPTAIPTSPTPTIVSPTISLETTPSPTSQPTSDRYQYPTSTKQSDGLYITVDSVQDVTNWYKDLMRNEGFSTITAIQTTTNGSVLNKLISVKGNTRLTIEIQKPASSDTVSIGVSLNK